MNVAAIPPIEQCHTEWSACTIIDRVLVTMRRKLNKTDKARTNNKYTLWVTRCICQQHPCCLSAIPSNLTLLTARKQVGMRAHHYIYIYRLLLRGGLR